MSPPGRGAVGRPALLSAGAGRVLRAPPAAARQDGMCAAAGAPRPHTKTGERPSEQSVCGGRRRRQLSRSGAAPAGRVTAPPPPSLEHSPPTAGRAAVAAAAPRRPTGQFSPDAATVTLARRSRPRFRPRPAALRRHLSAPRLRTAGRAGLFVDGAIGGGARCRPRARHGDLRIVAGRRGRPASGGDGRTSGAPQGGAAGDTGLGPWRS